jgi:hypothetical protein
MPSNKNIKYITKKDILQNIEFIKSKIDENEYKKLEAIYLMVYKQLNDLQIKNILNESYLF